MDDKIVKAAEAVIATEVGLPSSLSEIEQMSPIDLDTLIRSIAGSDPGQPWRVHARRVSDKVLDNFIKAEANKETKAASQPSNPPSKTLLREQEKVYRHLLDNDPHCATMARLDKAAGRRHFESLSVYPDLASEEDES